MNIVQNNGNQVVSVNKTIADCYKALGIDIYTCYKTLTQLKIRDKK